MTIRLSWSLLAMLACASCATLGRPAAAAEENEKFLAKYTSPSSDTAGLAAQEVADQQVICSREPRTASHLRTRRCFTRLELERMNRQSVGVMRRALKN